MTEHVEAAVGRNWTALSKAVSRALRHDPSRFGLELDADGWTPVGALVRGLRRDRRWPDLTAEDLAEMVRSGSKQRHEIAGDRIRARYGHSLPGTIARSPEVPPELLFHGTAAGSVPRILATGLEPMRRQHVHLSVDRATALAVGRRKSPEVVVLVVAAGSAAREAATRFYRGSAEVWLADRIPASYLARE